MARGPCLPANVRFLVVPRCRGAHLCWFSEALSDRACKFPDLLARLEWPRIPLVGRRGVMSCAYQSTCCRSEDHYRCSAGRCGVDQPG